MKNRKLLGFLLIIGVVAFSPNSFGKQINLPETTYFYSKISKNDVLHDNSYPREDLYYLYKDIQIKIIGDTLEIPNVCSTKVHKIEQKPIVYWSSFETEKLYNTLFNEENLPVKEQLNIINALYTDKICPQPFDELIMQDHLLIAIKEGYLILFSDQISPSAIEPNKDDSICKNLNFGDASYKSGNTCFFPNKQLSATYELYWKKAQEDEDKKHLRRIVEPMKNYKDIIEKGYLEINYHWINIKELKVDLLFSGGVTELIFKQKDDGTELTTIYNAD